MSSKRDSILFKNRSISVTQREILVDDSYYNGFFIGITMRSSPKKEYVIIEELDILDKEYSIVSPSGIDGGEGEIYIRSASMDSVTFNEMIKDWLLK